MDYAQWEHPSQQPQGAPTPIRQHQTAPTAIKGPAEASPPQDIDVPTHMMAPSCDAPHHVTRHDPVLAPTPVPQIAPTVSGSSYRAGARQHTTPTSNLRPSQEEMSHEPHIPQKDLMGNRPTLNNKTSNHRELDWADLMMAPLPPDSPTAPRLLGSGRTQTRSSTALPTATAHCEESQATNQTPPRDPIEASQTPRLSAGPVRKAPTPSSNSTTPTMLSTAPPLPQSIASRLPSMHDIFSTNIRVATTVHHMVRAEVQDLFAGLLRGTASGSEISFRLLFLFPKCVLGHSNNVAPTTALIRARISAWHARGYPELWEAVCSTQPLLKTQPRPPQKTPMSETPTKSAIATARPAIKRAMHLVREGEYSKAIQSLLSSGTVPKDAAAAEKLKALHPVSPPPAVEEEALLKLADNIEISERDLLSAVKSFSSSTATGVLGIKIPLLKQMLHHDTSGTFIRALRTFALTCAHGRIPHTVRPFLTGASLTGLPKQPSGIRPIAAGEILRRIVAKAVLAQVMGQTAQIFGDLQLGVGRKGGIEHIAFSCQKCVAENIDNPDFVGIKVDMKNAFNTLLRSKMLNAAKRFPVLAHWLSTCYGSHSNLWFGEFILSSQKGVQQGDPLGPLLFALTLLDTIKTIEELHPLLNKWYLDDGVIFGTHETIAKVIAILEGPALRDLGLELNPSKCELIWLRPAFARHDVFPKHFSNRIVDGNFTIVGAPIGDTKFQDLHIRKITADAQRVWAQLSELQDVQAAYTLFRACATWNKVAHLMRTTHPDVGAAAFRDFDTNLRSAFTHVTSLHFTDHQWTQLSLPTRKGGAGLRSAVHHSPAAFLAAALFFAQESSAPLEQLQGAARSLELVNGRIRNAPLDLAEEKLTQKRISGMVDDLTSDTLITGCSAGDRARLALVARNGAGEWLNVVPSDRFGTQMTSPEFLIALKRWVGQPVSSGEHKCPKCGDHTCDAYGNHALQCGSGACKYRRHNDLRDMIFKSSQAAGLKPILEPTNLGADEKRPADFLTSEGADRFCNDVFVIHPFAATHVTATLSDPGSATENYARKVKHQAFDKLPIAATHQLRALGADTFGGWNQEACEFLRFLGKSDATRHNSGVTEATRCLTRRLNFCIIRHCARAILLRSPATNSHPLEQKVVDTDKTTNGANNGTSNPPRTTTAPHPNQSTQYTVEAGCDQSGTELHTPKTTTTTTKKELNSPHLHPLLHPPTIPGAKASTTATGRCHTAQPRRSTAPHPNQSQQSTEPTTQDPAPASPTPPTTRTPCPHIGPQHSHTRSDYKPARNEPHAMILHKPPTGGDDLTTPLSPSEMQTNKSEQKYNQRETHLDGGGC